MRNRNRSSSSRKDKEYLDSDGDGDHPLAHTAAANGDVSLLMKAVQQDPVVINQRDSDGQTPLTLAVHGKHSHAVKRLVKMGADVNAQDIQGRTCLSIATYESWSDGVIYLLRKGANQTLADKAGRTPLHAATYDTDTRSLTALMKRLSFEDLNAADNEKMTALHWAAFHDRPEHLRLLLQKGAISVLQDIDGKTALHWAAQNGRRSCCSILCERNNTTGIVHIVDNCAKTVLHLAAAAGKPLVLQHFIHMAPDLCEAEDQDDRTPLHWAAAMGHSECIQVLLQAGCLPNPFDVDGITPLEYAKRASHKQCMGMLEASMALQESKEAAQSSSAQQKRSGGFFKGIFSKKQKQNTDKTVVSSTHLPKVYINGDKEKTKSKQTGVSYGKSNEEDLDTRRQSNHKTASQLETKGDINSEQSVTPSERRRKRKKHKRNTDDVIEMTSPASNMTSSSWHHNGTASPATALTSSSWNENVVLSDHSSPRPTLPRSMHLSPIGVGRQPSVSPHVSHDGNGVLQPSPLRRQGELNPIRMPKWPSSPAELPIPNNLASLQQETSDVYSRSPTPPPLLSRNLVMKKALPDISPLTHDMGSLDIAQVNNKRHKKKKQKHEHPSPGDHPPPNDIDYDRDCSL